MSDKLARTIARFQTKINNGEFYEAHQTLRTITNRFVKSKNYDEAINLLYQGSVILSTNKEYSSSSDLILYLIEIIQENCSERFTKELKLQFVELVSNLPNSEPSLIDISKKLINLSKVVDDLKFGETIFHNVFGNKFLQQVQNEEMVETEREKLFQLAELHLILGSTSSLEMYVDFLFQWFKSSSSQDPGIYLGRAIINYAYLMNLQYMRDSLDRFLQELIKYDSNYQLLTEGSDKIYYYEKFELVNFFQLLVITLSKSDNGKKFMKLYETYRLSLQQSELINSVDYIGRLYYKLKLGNPQNQNMLANFMSGLFK